MKYLKLFEVKNVIKREVNNIALKLPGGIRKYLKDYEYSERKKSLGKLYPDKTFYVIRLKPISSSIGVLVRLTCHKLQECDSKGYIPVIDFSYNKNVYLEEDEIGKINPWEYFFEQPTMFSTRAVYHAKNVIFGYINDKDSEYDEIIDNEDKLKEYCAIYKKYIHISKRIEKKAESIYSQIIRPEWRVLGCVYRGTDYRNRKVVNEHRQPSIQEEIEKAKELMDKWNCDHIFLATEDKGGLDAFRKAFNDKLVYVSKKRYPSDVTFTQKFRFKRKHDLYYKGEEYLMEIYILSRCNCLLSSRVGILGTALPMNNQKYEHKYIYDLGIYTEEDYNLK